MGLFEDFTIKRSKDISKSKRLLKHICCFNNEQSRKKSSEDDLEAYINFITKLVFNCLLCFIFIFCGYLSFFGGSASSEIQAEIPTYNLLKYANESYSLVFIDYQKTSSFNFFQREYQNFFDFLVVSFSNNVNTRLNFDSVFICLSLFSMLLLFVNYLCSNKSKEVISSLNVFYIIFVDVFFGAIFFNFNSTSNEAFASYIRFFYFFIFNTIIFVLFNLDTTVKEIFWLFIYKLILIIAFIFTSQINKEPNLNLFLFEIAFFILTFLFMSIYISIRMDFRVRSTEFYLIQKNQNEYYQKLINLINKSFLSLNFTFFKINYNEPFLNFLKTIGLDDYDINENINYSSNNNNENLEKAKINLKKIKTNAKTYQSNLGNKHQTNNFSNIHVENDAANLMRKHTKKLFIKGAQSGSDLQDNNYNNNNNFINKQNVYNNFQIINKQNSQKENNYFNSENQIKATSNLNNIDSNNYKENENNMFIKNVFGSNNNNNNYAVDVPNNLQTTADYLLTKNDAGFKQLFNDDISKITKILDVSNLNTNTDKRNPNSASFISKDNPFININTNISNSNVNKRGFDSINNNFNLTNNLNTKLNNNDKANNNYFNKANNKNENFDDQQNLKFKKNRTKIQKRLDRKMRRRRNRNLVNEEDIFVQKLEFLLEEVFSCFIKEENEIYEKEKTKTFNFQNKEKTLMSDVIKDIFRSKNDISFNFEFQGKGVFTSLPNIKNKITIELYYRRVQTFEGEVIEFYIDDITYLRQRESEKVKKVFQKLVLPNILHEVKLGFNLFGFFIKNILTNKSKLNFPSEINNENANINNDNNNFKEEGMNNLKNSIISVSPFSYNVNEKRIVMGKTQTLKESFISMIEHNWIKEQNEKAKIGKDFKNTNGDDNKKIESDLNLFSKIRSSKTLIENINLKNKQNIDNCYNNTSKLNQNTCNQIEHLKYALILNEYFLSIISEFPNYSFAYNISKASYEFEFKPEFENFDIYETMYFAFEILKKLINLKGLKDCVKPVIELDPNLPQFFNSDQKRLKEILLNLIDNSLKYTKKGFIKISAELNIDKNLKELSSFSYIKFSVEDSGIGIQDNKLSEILLLFGNNNNLLGLGEETSNRNRNSSRNSINEIKQINTMIEEKEIKFNTAADLKSKGQGLILIKQILDKIGKGVNCFSIPNETTIFSFVLDNKLIDVSSKRYDFGPLNRNNYLAQANPLSRKNTKTPLEALNGLNTILMMKPIDIKDSNNNNNKQNKLIQFKTPKRNNKIVSLPNIFRKENNNNYKSIYYVNKNSSGDLSENIQFIDKKNTSNSNDRHSSVNYSNNYGSYFSESERRKFNNRNKRSNSLNGHSNKNLFKKYKYLIGEKDLTQEIASEKRVDIKKKEGTKANLDSIQNNKINIIRNDSDETILESPKEMEKKFQKISNNLINEEFVKQNKNHSEFQQTSTKIKNKLYDKKRLMSEIFYNFDSLSEILVLLFKFVKSKDCKIILIVGFNEKDKKIVKAKIKKIWKNNLINQQEKVKVISIKDGIFALLLLYLEKQIFTNKKCIIHSVIFFDDNMKANENKFADCFGLYETLKKNNFESNKDLKIGIFSDELNVKKTNAYMNPYALIDNNFYNDLHVIKISQSNENGEYLRNGKYFDIEKDYKNIENEHDSNQKFSYNDLLRFFKY